MANVTSASVTYSNNLEKIETIRSDGKVEAIDLGVASLSGSIAVRYGDNALMDKARAGISKSFSARAASTVSFSLTP